MKVGDLVKIREGGSGLVWDGEIPPDAVGIVVEEPSTACFQKGGALPSMWVQWPDRKDWDSMEIEDLQVIS
jgi:hypothetical protein|tara:strand:+ start:473 stop:685 length:213 start_codon:yes stop_codon:yes gene_type:complete